MMEDKTTLVDEILALINEYGSESKIDPKILDFLEENDLISIRNSLIDSKKHHLDDKEWLHQFKRPQ